MLFTVGFVYSAGVWDSLYVVLFALDCSASLSFFVMAHVLLAFWLDLFRLLCAQGGGAGAAALPGLLRRAAARSARPR